MGKVKLSDQPGATPVEPTETPDQAPEQEQSKSDTTAVTKTQSLLPGDKVPTVQDIILPRINIVQGVGILKDTFPQGAIVHGQSTVLYEQTVVDKTTGNVKKQGTPPIVGTVIGFRPVQFAEKVPGGGMGLIVNTEAEVRANGGTLDYNEWKLKEKDGMKRFEYSVDAVVVLERPEHLSDDDTIFTFPCGDKKYAIALWKMKGSGYTQCAKKTFFTARAMGCLKAGGYSSWSFSFSTATKTFAGNTYYVPQAIPLEKNSDEFLAFVTGILHAPTQDSEDTAAE